MTYKDHHGLTSAYLSSCIPYHTRRIQYSPVCISIHAFSYLWVFAHAVWLPGPFIWMSSSAWLILLLILRMFFYPSLPLWSLSWPTKCKSMPSLRAPTALLIFFNLKGYYTIHNGLCLIWILLQTITLVYLGKDWFYLTYQCTPNIDTGTDLLQVLNKFFVNE